MESERKALHMREEVTPQCKDEMLPDLSHDLCEVIREKTRDDGDQKCRNARTVEDFHPGKRSAVQPCANERDTSTIVG